MDKESLHIIFSGITAIATIIAVYFAYWIGRRQNEINQQALELDDFAEVFLMPQQVIYKGLDSEDTQIGWNLLIKNASSYTVYVHEYVLNGKSKKVGGSALPNHSDSWYAIPIKENDREYSISVLFEDHKGRKYKTNGTAVFTDNWWSINSVKREEIK